MHTDKGCNVPEVFKPPLHEEQRPLHQEHWGESTVPFQHNGVRSRETSGGESERRMKTYKETEAEEYKHTNRDRKWTNKRDKEKGEGWIIQGCQLWINRIKICCINQRWARVTERGSVPVKHVMKHKSINSHSRPRWTSKMVLESYIHSTTQPACIAARSV